MTMIPANRMELLKLKSELKLSKKGHSLLEKKRDTLVTKLINLMREYKVVKANAIDKLGKAHDLLITAEAVSGFNRVKGVSYSSEDAFDIDFKSEKIMGVSLPVYAVEFKKVNANFSPLGLSNYVYGARSTYLETVPLMIEASRIEESIFILAEEIKKVKRRVNSLENIRIPALNKDISNVRLMIEEADRENFIRLKNAKKKVV